jgi:polysaccharide biosynthesis/export protein
MRAPSFVILLLIVVFFSCSSAKKVVYFDNIQDSTISSKLENLEPVIQRNDILSISVSSLNQEATQVFNTPNSQGAAGYLVNQDGTIDFPMLGTIPVVGLTKKKIKELITKGLVDKKLLLSPIVDVRYLNYKITVLGEVGHPTVITTASEKMTLLEAIGLAGDLTINAKRNNVMIIRETEGVKSIKRIDLTKRDLFTSPYYYLKSNDIVYVEPNSVKISGASKTNQMLPLVISSLSFALLVVDRIIK